MATISSGISLRAGHIVEKLETALTELRGSLDAFVSDRMRRAAAEAEYPRHSRCVRSPSVDPQ
jgi:hypothetical protein